MSAFIVVFFNWAVRPYLARMNAWKEAKDRKADLEVERINKKNRKRR